jgi:hypothetical protein
LSPSKIASAIAVTARATLNSKRHRISRPTRKVNSDATNAPPMNVRGFA